MTNQSAQSGNKAILVIFVLAIVVVIGGVMFMRFYRDDIAEQKTRVTESGRLADFEKLKEQINDKYIDVTIMEKALEEFVSYYGENTTEANELRMLLDKRKNAQIQAARIDSEITDKANEIKRSIENSDISVEFLDSEIVSFIARFGEDRKEIPELRRLLRERKNREKKSLTREEAIVSRAKTLIARINDENETLKSLQTAVSEFIIDYGDDRKEIPELRRLLEERKKDSEKELSREGMIAEEAKILASRINNKDENLAGIESSLSEFVIRYGEDRKEVPELRRLISKRKEAERLEALIAKDAERLISRVNDPKYSIRDLEQSINEFIDNYGEDVEVVLEFNQLLSVRKKEEEQETMIANKAALLSSKIGDQNYSVEELQTFLDDFIRTYGESRMEVPNLQVRLKERRESDLHNRLSQEAQDLMARIKDRNNSIDSIQDSLKKFVADYGDNHVEIQELRLLLDDRQSEDAIAALLSSLDTLVLSGNASRISSMVADTEYAERLAALTEWSGLIFRHHIQFFHRDGDNAEVRVELENAADHVPKRKLYFNYSLLRDGDDWKIKRSEKMKN